MTSSGSVAKTTPDVPSTTDTGPGAVTPTPSAPAAWSPAPAATGDAGRASRRSGDGDSSAGGSQAAGKLERGEHLVAPAAAGDVEEEGSGGVGDVGRTLAREREPDVVLREQDVGDALVGLRLVRAQPEQLRAR